MSESTTAEERARWRRWAKSAAGTPDGDLAAIIAAIIIRLAAECDRLAAERDRYRAALLSRSFAQEDWGRIELALKRVVRNDLVDDDAYDAYDALYERVKAINRVGLVPEKGDADAR